MLHDVCVIFVCDNCSDDAPNLLMQHQKPCPAKTIVKTMENENHRGTVRIAKARNACLHMICDEISDVNCHIMIDADDACSNEWNCELIEKCSDDFDDDDWDCTSFNRDGHHDIWALQFDGFKHHCWGWQVEWSHNLRTMDIVRNEMMNKLKSASSSGGGNGIDVCSAFNGFCTHKSSRFAEFHHDGYCENVKKLIGDEDGEETTKCSKNKCNMNVACNEGEGDGECCEHIFHHASALKQNGKMKISKFKVI